MKLGLSSYAYRWSIGVENYAPSNPMTFEQFVNKAIYLNLDGVQACDHLRFFDLPDYKLKEISDKIEDHGMFVETGASSCNPGYLETALQVSGKVGAKILRAIPEIDRNGTKEHIQRQIDQIVQDFVQVLTCAKDLDIRLALENHAQLASEELVQIVESIDDDFVRVCLDTMNSIVFMENPLTTVRVLAPYAITVHLKDFRIEKNPREHRIVGTPLGEGLLDLPQIMQIVRESNLEPSINLELLVDRRENEEETLRWEEECVLESVNYARTRLFL